MDNARDVNVLISCPEWTSALPTAEKISRRAALAALSHGPRRVETSVMLADNATMTRLNRDYRGKDEPTNVLAFGGLDVPADPDAPVVLGDVVVAYETAAAEVAGDPGQRSLFDHLSHLVVHGTLHLLGYDHDTDEAAESMEAVETEILAGLGIADPYAPWRPFPHPLDDGASQSVGRS